MQAHRMTSIFQMRMQIQLFPGRTHPLDSRLLFMGGDKQGGSRVSLHSSSACFIKLLSKFLPLKFCSFIIVIHLSLIRRLPFLRH